MHVTVTDLVDRPGATRAVDVLVPVEELGSDSWGPADGALEDPVALDLHLDAVVEGILVRGTIGFTLTLACGRCLEPQRTHRDVEVVELFVDPARYEDGDEVDEGYELLDERTRIDLSTLVRDALLVDLPLRVLCRPDCQGLCPTCGADRNTTDCGHRAGAEPDPRWGVLADLDLSAD